jgi:hypothetical protein
LNNSFLTPCCLSRKETLRGVTYRAIDGLTGFSARKMLENSEFSAALVFVKNTGAVPFSVKVGWGIIGVESPEGTHR